MERQFRSFHYHRSEPASNSVTGGQAALADGQRYQWLQRRMARRHSQYYLLPRARDALCDGDGNFYTDCDYTSVADAHGYSHGYRATEPYADGYSYIHDDAQCHGNSYSHPYAHGQADADRAA
jgi:hypothetical protein